MGWGMFQISCAYIWHIIEDTIKDEYAWIFTIISKAPSLAIMIHITIMHHLLFLVYDKCTCMQKRKIYLSVNSKRKESMYRNVPWAEKIQAYCFSQIWILLANPSFLEEVVLTCVALSPSDLSLIMAHSCIGTFCLSDMSSISPTGGLASSHSFSPPSQAPLCTVWFSFGTGDVTYNRNTTW